MMVQRFRQEARTVSMMVAWIFLISGCGQMGPTFRSTQSVTVYGNFLQCRTGEGAMILFRTVKKQGQDQYRLFAEKRLDPPPRSVETDLDVQIRELIDSNVPVARVAAELVDQYIPFNMWSEEMGTILLCPCFDLTLLAIILSSFGVQLSPLSPIEQLAVDFDHNWVIDLGDLSSFLSHYGSCGT